MRTADFEFELPPELIAQQPAPERDQSRLLVLSRESGTIRHCRFPDLIDYLQPGDALVLNNSRVIRARLRGHNARTGGQFEILLLEEVATNVWWVMLKPGKRARKGIEIKIVARQHPCPAPDMGIVATVAELNDEGHRQVTFRGTADILNELDHLGEVPLPPYIARPDKACESEDITRYQTVFANEPGSVAAPTAGLHFTEQLLARARARGVSVCFVTLHVGLGTFAPVKAERISEHVMHEERFELPPETVSSIERAQQRGGRVFAVGTTTLRTLESVAATHNGRLVAGRGRTRIFIIPPYAFKVVNAMITNFHLPRSTLLMLVSAFAAPGETTGRELMLEAYAQAVAQRYRFFSYGDGMLIL